MDIVINGIYRHFRNQQLYRVIGIAVHSETLQEMVVYTALYEHEPYPHDQLWVRPKDMFIEKLWHEGHETSRFEWTGETASSDTNI